MGANVLKVIVGIIIVAHCRLFLVLVSIDINCLETHSSIKVRISVETKRKISLAKFALLGQFMLE